MKVIAVYILMFEYNIWDIVKPHHLHIIIGKLRKLGVSQFIIRVGIQGDVHHRTLGAGICGNLSFEIFKCPANIKVTTTVIIDFVG